MGARLRGTASKCTGRFLRSPAGGTCPLASFFCLISLSFSDYFDFTMQVRQDYVQSCSRFFLPGALLANAYFY
jgi:hypothetical protein